MVVLIDKLWGYDPQGKPSKYHVYVASAKDDLPDIAPVGSRAVLDDGTVRIKTPQGWHKKEVSA